MRRRTCEGKRSYPDRKAAYAALNGTRRTFGEARTGEKMHIYPCPFCKKWHVGHLSVGVRRTRKNFRELV
jgi:hypothetical protein